MEIVSGHRPIMQGIEGPVYESVSRDVITLGFLLWSLGMAMTVSQDYVGEDSTVRYMMFTLPLVFAALSRPLALANALGKKAMWLFPFMLFSVIYHTVQGDITASLQVGLLVLGIVWFCSTPVQFIREDIYRLYILFVITGILIWIFTDFNRWGVIPGTTDPAYGIWRISFFPNIAFTAFFSLFIIIISTKNGIKDIDNKYVIFLAAYFLIFSYVRTAILCFALYVFCHFLFKKINRSGSLLLTSIAVAISANIFIAYSSSIFEFLQNIPIISRLFLRGETQLSEFEIYQQLYRPWLWGEQLKLFASSPYLMGWGSAPFFELVQNTIFDLRLEVSDTVSLPTRLLSQFGLAAIFFWVFLLACLKQAADRMDRWGCAVFPVVFTAMMHWGSMFHVTDPMSILYFGLLVKGSEFVSGSSKLSELSQVGQPAYNLFVHTKVR